MTDYDQPEFYRFNQDSLALVRFILKTDISPKSLLDIGAGCGVIGLELALKLKPLELTLLELQTEFQPYLEKNTSQFQDLETLVSIAISSIGSWVSNKKFDLIACNPPYYLPRHGKDSDDPRRDLCRSFKQDGWEVLVEKIFQCLDPHGRAFLVIKNDSVLMKSCEKAVAKTQLEKIFHIEGQLCFVELYPRD